MPGTQIFPREPDSLTIPNQSFARNAPGSVIDGTRQKILVFANSSIDVVGDRDYYELEFDRVNFGAPLNAYFSVVLVPEAGTSFDGLLSLYDGTSLIASSDSTQGGGSSIFFAFEGHLGGQPNLVVEVSENGNDAIGNYTLFLANLPSRAQQGTSGNDMLSGHQGLIGGSGNDTLTGSARDDLLSGNLGSDSMSGGAGDDLYLDVGSGDVVTELAEEGIDTASTRLPEFTLPLNVENLSFIGIGPITARGNSLNNYILTSQAGDAVLGEGGNDTIIAADGSDYINGGAGGDLLFGGSGNDTVLGDTGNDYLNAGSDDDLIMGGPGDDTVLGSDGDDYVNGQDGDDLVFGGEGADTVIGDPGNDYINGENGNDIVLGGSGNDTVLGGDGSDYINGGSDDDQVFGGNSADVLIGDDGSDYLNGEAGDDNLTGASGNDTLLGADGNDYLSGGTGDDNLTGGLGDDTLFAGAGSDYLKGDAGDDFFIFEANFGTSLIIDFETGTPAHHDFILFKGGVFADAADVLAHAVQQATNVIITASTGDSLTLANVQLANLVADDFRFA
jgi:Ca2+-binding RTX toxin-like protein